MALLDGRRSRDEVDRWASVWVTTREDEVEDEAVWWALGVLCGIDLREAADGPYLHPDDQVAEWLEEFRLRCRSS
ncbi:hypothetical protein [Cellulomonas sp. ATA003]|uniref:hypothetical protein n=1 Tax=Cellulomonas sp. ATA003 TaxID=3073064 RepID=UPI002873CC23|nr:hypothetical protein [Cellulomonas sp. ATA003]WNB84339.1 hypothetical protein REH70_10635 [Cellulomonas sp. ATA003]